MKKIITLLLSFLFIVTVTAKKEPRAMSELLKGIEYQISIGHYQESLSSLEVILSLGEIYSRVYLLKGIANEGLNQQALAKNAYEKAKYYLNRELLITPHDSLLNDTKMKLKTKFLK